MGVLRDGVKEVQFSTSGSETGLIVLSGDAEVAVNGLNTALSQHDGLYIPRGSKVEVRSDGGTDIAEFSRRRMFTRSKWCGLATSHRIPRSPGAPTRHRRVFIVLGENVQARRLRAGITVSDPCNWTSGPPHAMLEEMYVYFDMPAPAYGIQLVYTKYPELATVVRDGDAVLMPAGYHPNVSRRAPGQVLVGPSCASRARGRQYGVVNVQPEFQS
jgi:5-deoxy-glucuronate isomerase